jgi:predicted metal-dependent peptidase
MSTTTETQQEKNPDNFWGQPHVEGEKFSDREFEPDFLAIYMHEPFLGGVSMEITKTPDPQCSTAYVGVGSENELVLGYNPYFFRSLTPKERKGTIVHELYHVILQHLFERNITDRKYAMAWNIGTDLAINSIIGANNLPAIALVPGKVPPKVKQAKLANYIKSVNPLQISEFYFEGVKQLMEEMEQNGESLTEGEMTLDDHSNWDGLDDAIKDQVRDKVRGMLQKAVNRADSKNSWGSVPASMQAEIRKNLTHEIDWRSIMRMFFGVARSLTRISTIKKVSRKLPGILPGVKRGTTARFAFFIDQSGSMSDTDVALAFAEVEAASKEAEIDVYNFDTEIDESSHKVWKRGKKFAWGRTRCGGTDFNAVANFVNQSKNLNRWSGVCILTDGYAPTLGYVKGARVLWVITPTGTVSVARPGDILVHLKRNAVEF